MPRIVDFSQDPPILISTSAELDLREALARELANSYNAGMKLTNVDFISGIDWFKFEEPFSRVLWSFGSAEHNRADLNSALPGGTSATIFQPQNISDTFRYHVLSEFMFPDFGSGSELRFKIHGGHVRPGVTKHFTAGNAFSNGVPTTLFLTEDLGAFNQPPTEKTSSSLRFYFTESRSSEAYRLQDLSPISAPIFPKDDVVIDPSVSGTPSDEDQSMRRKYFRINEGDIFGGGDTTYGSDGKIVLVFRYADNIDVASDPDGPGINWSPHLLFRYRGVISMSVSFLKVP